VTRKLQFWLLTLALLAATGPLLRAGTASNVTGLYYTGVDNSGNLLSGGTDSHWTVTYARVNGSGSTSSSYTGSAYVVSGSYIDGAWVQNTSSAQWITAPGASTAQSGGTTNAGGDYLPGNGTSGNNAAYYVYRLAFQITGSGTGSVSNNIAINMTIAADDAYTVYVNPSSAPTVSNNGTINSGGTTASASGTSAWNNTTAITLANYGTNDNSNFVIGTNYIYIVVANTNSQTGSNSSNALNPSGLLVYQVGTAVTIDGRPIPEVGTWMPMAGALGVFGWLRWRRRRAAR
jgi:hypothetical protein